MTRKRLFFVEMMMVSAFVLDQHAKLYLYSTTSLK